MTNASNACNGCIGSDGNNGCNNCNIRKYRWLQSFSILVVMAKVEVMNRLAVNGTKAIMTIMVITV